MMRDSTTDVCLASKRPARSNAYLHYCDNCKRVTSLPHCGKLVTVAIDEGKKGKACLVSITAADTSGDLLRTKVLRHSNSTVESSSQHSPDLSLSTFIKTSTTPLLQTTKIEQEKMHSQSERVNECETMPSLYPCSHQYLLRVRIAKIRLTVY